MIKAYHFVPEWVMNAVIAQGEILPGIERLDPTTFVWDCQNLVNELRELVEGDDGDVDEVALEALLDLIDVEIRKLERHRGQKKTQRETEFLCIDLLAGDLSRVFLSFGGWVQWVPEETGFVFDLEHLVKKGASIRLHDYSGDFIDRLKWVLSDSWRSKESAKRAMKFELREFTKRNEYRGKKAIDLLRNVGTGVLKQEEPEKGRAEIVWDGPLPLDWAIEVWDEGRKVAV